LKELFAHVVLRMRCVLYHQPSAYDGSWEKKEFCLKLKLRKI